MGAAAKKNKKPVARRAKPGGVQVKTTKDYSDLVWFESQRQGLSARDIADKATKMKCPVGAQTVANHMAGNVTSPTLRTFVAILTALGFDVRVKAS